MTGRSRGTTAPAPEGTRSPGPGVYRAYHWVLGVLLLLGAVQIVLAGVGAFSLMSQNGGPGFEPHRTNGFIMSGVALVVVVLALLARVGTRAVVMAVVLFVLAAVGQSLFAGLGVDNAWVGGLHALAGLVIIGLTGYLFGSSADAVRRR
jgi:hypothetical protein